MDISTLVNTILCILSFILAVISVGTVIITLRQNHTILKQNTEILNFNYRTLEESTRPFISIYFDTLTICEQTSYFVLKNFGHSPARITSFKYDPILKQTQQGHIFFKEQFDFIENIVLSPGQTKLLEYDVTRLPIDSLTFNISYENNGNSYEETVTLNVKNYVHLPVSRPESYIPENNKREVHILREMLERSL